jgi:hypothetical protein
LLLAICSPAFAEPEAVRFSNAPVTIDGKALERSWKDAEWRNLDKHILSERPDATVTTTAAKSGNTLSAHTILNRLTATKTLATLMPAYSVPSRWNRLLPENRQNLSSAAAS